MQAQAVCGTLKINVLQKPETAADTRCCGPRQGWRSCIAASGAVCEHHLLKLCRRLHLELDLLALLRPDLDL